jgi:putative ABC transport system ATP-binding protein
MSGGTPLLSGRGLHKRFGPTPALQGMDLHVDAGEVLAVMGPSGTASRGGSSAPSGRTA